MDEVHAVGEVSIHSYVSFLVVLDYFVWVDSAVYSLLYLSLRPLSCWLSLTLGLYHCGALLYISFGCMLRALFFSCLCPDDDLDS